MPISADAPLLIGDGVGELPCDANIPVGFNPEWEYTLQEAQIYSGTTILLFTDGLTEAVHQFVGEAEQSDDLTMMGIQFIKKTEPSA